MSISSLHLNHCGGQRKGEGGRVGGMREEGGEEREREGEVEHFYLRSAIDFKI